jgi:hypothetical protein
VILGQAKQFSAKTASLPAPIGGWNARDSLAQMAPTDAVTLINWFPTPTDVTLRKGYTQYSTGITGNVESLMNYAGTSSQTLFAIANGVIYRCNAGAATSVFTGLSNSKFQHINVTTAGGHYLVACNGVDPTIIYDGTSWSYLATTSTAATISTITRVGTLATLTTATAHGLVTGNKVTISGATPSAFNGTFVITVTGSTTFTYTMASTPASNATVVGTYTVLGITGVNSNTFVNVNLFKNRLFFTQVNTLKCWYLDVNAIAGAASPLDFGGIARNGGFLQAMGTWTLDAGQGADDYAVFVTNMGETLVYNGTDPTSATTWALKGVWQLGQTFNRRCFFKWSGDLLLLTQDGLVPLSSALQSSRLDPRVNLTDKIYFAVSVAASNYYDNFGWQINYFASENMLILNIPITGGTQQYVMHTITKSWGQFTGIEANCFEVSGKEGMYFGGNGYVGKFYDGTSDNGSNITATSQQAYSYFDTPGQLKRFTMVRPILQTSGGTPGVLCGLSVDFDTQSQLGSVTFNPGTIGAGDWDAAVWDTSLWGGGLVTNKNWQGVTGLGFAASINLNVASQGIELHWASTDYVMESGGVL